MTPEDIKDDVRVAKDIADFKTELDEKEIARRKKIDPELIARHRYDGLFSRREPYFSPCNGAKIA